MEKRRKKRNKSIVVMTFILIILTLIAIVVVKSCLDKKTAEKVIFPYDAGDGIIIESMFQYSGINPDYENQEGENITAITVRNESKNYLANAKVTMIDDEGKAMCFKITNFPAGKKMMAFECENKDSSDESIIREVICEKNFETETAVNEDVSVSVNGTHIVLKNNIDKEIKNIAISCHSVFAEQYFGGIAYTYTVDKLPAQGTMELEAMDCILDQVEVVRVEINEK